MRRPTIAIRHDPGATVDHSESFTTAAVTLFAHLTNEQTN